MLKLKRLPPKKLQFTATTIRILSEAEAKQIAGGIPATRTDSKINEPGCP